MNLIITLLNIQHFAKATPYGSDTNIGNAQQLPEKLRTIVHRAGSPSAVFFISSSASSAPGLRQVFPQFSCHSISSSWPLRPASS
jgi:hypothetical protein